MEKKLRRLLVLLVTVVLLVGVLATGVSAAQTEELDCYMHGDLNEDGKITHRDALYLLYNAMSIEGYPLNQYCDFNGNTIVEPGDAFYLLYASFGDEDCPLNGMIHHYAEPLWTWIEGDAGVGVTATIKCSCGAEAIEFIQTDEEHPIKLEQGAHQAATCTVDGKQAYTASFVWNGKTYTATKEFTEPATGHTKQGQLTCETGVTCANCDYEVAPLGHKWVLDPAASTAATCQAAATQAYACENCDATKTESVEGVGAHAYAFFQDVNDGCKYDSVYKCGVCGHEEVMGTYYKHTYTATLTKEATCSVTGVKTYTCSCGDSYTEDVPKNDSHTWVAGAAAENVTTYSCACGETKTVVTAVDTAVSVSAADELQLKEGTSVALDEATKEQLGEEAEIKVSVEVVTEDLGLSEEQKEQIGDNPVYDFNMVSVDAEGNEEEVSNFGGLVTVTLPYTLEEGEDIDSIDVWFIDNNGKLTRMEATYSNGCVTFTTNHFSYYTVTRLTAEERCARYGCALKEYTKDASCTADGYKKVLCTRCGKVESDVTIGAKGHSYNVVTDKKPTCTEDGLLEKKCSVCSHTTSEKIPALGHDIQTETKDATCQTAGETTIRCKNCDLVATEVLAKLNHDYGMPVIKEATCTEGGYVKAVCTVCGHEDISGETAALGHNYQEGQNAWTWSANNAEATVTLVCAHDATHTKVLNAVVTLKNVNATCTEGGQTVYTAAAAYGGKTYNASKSVENSEPAGHKPAVEWSSNASEHYHVCNVCGEKLGVAAHVWGADQVIKAPTCTTAGTAKVACTDCGYETEKTLPATGEHTYVDGVCSNCGHEENTCDHIRMYKTEMDLSSFNLCEGTKIWNVSCDCGEKTYPYFNLKCNLVYEENNGEQITLPNGVKAYVSTGACANCGLHAVVGDYMAIDEEECMLNAYQYVKVSVDDVVIVESVVSMGGMEPHPHYEKPVASYDLEELGMCAGTYEVYACPCGFSSSWGSHDGCNWMDGARTEENGVTTTTYTCSKCGAVRKEITSFRDDLLPCHEAEYTENIFYVDGKEVLKLVSSFGFPNHDYRLVDFELDGNSCEDGLLYVLKCEKCGDEWTQYVFSHAAVDKQVISLEGKDCDAKSAIQFTCPCGEHREWDLSYDRETWCEWEWEESEDGKQRSAVCRKCGMVRNETEIHSEKDEDCMVKVSSKVVLSDKNGNELCTLYGDWNMYDHQMEHAAELLVEGGSCADGLKVIRTCKNCDYYDAWTTNEHVGIVQETFDVSALNMCADKVIRYACPCGDSQWVNYGEEEGNCWWSWRDEWENGCETYCEHCNTTRVMEWEDLGWIDTCHLNRAYTETFVDTEGNTATIEYEIVETIHGGETFDLVLLDGAADCDGGYHAYRNCSVCGVREYFGIQHGHNSFPIRREVICEEGLCSKLSLITWSCACGYETWSRQEWSGTGCEFYNRRWDDALQAEVSECFRCGALRAEQRKQTPVEGETCRVNREITTTYYDKAGNQLASYTTTERGEEHDDLASFRMNGTTCEEGYYVIWTCQDCGSVRDFNEYRTDCDTFRVAKETLYTSDCGEIALYQNMSPCGEQQRWGFGGDCDFIWMGWDEKLDMEIAQCSNCGLKIAQRYHEHDRIPGTCDTYEDYTILLLDGEEEVARAEKSCVTRSHQYVHSFQMNGESCEDGYLVFGTCARCGEQQNWVREEYGHNGYLIGFYDLKEYGLCSGELHIVGCPCGLENGFGWENWNCYMDTIGQMDPETGLDIWQCSETGVYFVEGQVGDVDRENCRFNGKQYVKIFGDDYSADPVLNLSWDISYESHDDRATSLVLMNPEGGCNEGVHAVVECASCGRVTEENYSGHREWAEDRLDLSEYADTCGGEIVVGGCACGMSTFFHEGYNCNMETVAYTEETDANGIRHEIWDKECPNCGLSFVEDRYEVPDLDNCRVSIYWDYTFYVNGAEIKTMQNSAVDEQHDNIITGTLMDGATSCEEGAIITTTCRRCGLTGEGTTYDHATFMADSIDLSQYGSVCGAALDHFRCACGRNERYEIANGSACDVDRQQLDQSEWWVSGVLDDSQHTTEEHRGAWSYFYKLKCAVSEPACGLSMKKAEYWLKDGCQATRYQHWQILDASDNVVWDSGHFATGETMAFHDYVETHIDETLADGGRTEGWLYTCADCGSTYQNLYHYNADGTLVKFEQHAINTLDNGENREWNFYRTYNYVANNHHYADEEYNEYLRADGSVFWQRYAFTYDFFGSCKVTIMRTNCYGDNYSWTEEAHVGSWYNQYVSPTCTQFGYHEEYGYCDVCGDRWDYRYEILEPTCHDWYDAGDGIYRCSTCGLESTQGASGVIVMEDMSHVYHNGASYIVGYYNRENLDFVPNVSLVLENANGEDNLIDLDVSVEDLQIEDVCAMYIDKAEAIAAAEAAMAEAGYSGNYAIRITFVPVNYSDDLDYAITFDSLTYNPEEA